MTDFAAIRADVKQLAVERTHLTPPKTSPLKYSRSGRGARAVRLKNHQRVYTEKENGEGESQIWRPAEQHLNKKRTILTFLGGEKTGKSGG